MKNATNPSLNKLYYGDNLEVLRKYVRDETVDLCYIDPPFNSKRNYNQIYNNIGREDIAQAQAFVDTWTWNDHANECLEDIMSNANGVQTKQSIALIQGLGAVLGKGSLFAYLVNMTVRIAEIHRVLKETGSFYLHCDPNASHYLKIICDAIFCSIKGDFRNELIWKRAETVKGNFGQGSTRFDANHDVIFFFAKSDKNTFHPQFKEYSEKYITSFYKYVEPDTGRRYQLISMTGPGGSAKGNPQYEIMGITRFWRYSKQKMHELINAGMVVQTNPGAVPRRKQYLDEGKGVSIQTVWDDVPALHAQASERLGYPTQKPEALLERIINASSNEGDTILDAYCGCGTTVAAAQKLNRRWIGIDITYQSISLIMKRLRKIEGASELVEMHGIPRDLQSVEALIKKKDDRVRKEFEKWAVLTFSDNHAIINEKRGADKGVDGVAFTVTGHDERGSVTSSPVIFSVKSGHVNPAVVRELYGTIEREKAVAGILITLEHPTKPMIQEAKQAGQFKGDFATFDRLQIVTVEEILNNKRMNLPLYAEVVKSAQTDSGAKQQNLFS